MLNHFDLFLTHMLVLGYLSVCKFTHFLSLKNTSLNSTKPVQTLLGEEDALFFSFAT